MAIAFNNQNNSIGIGSTYSSGFTTSIAINSTGVGIGTTNPTQTLDVRGNVRITGGLYDSNNNIGAASSVLSSTGSGLIWVAPNSGAQGTQGTQGTTGTGTQGTQGTQGTTGTGTQGTQGTQGTTGTGTQGTQGTQGITGTGTQGTQGTQGLQGLQGLQGTSGPSTTINATAVTSNGTFYPVFVSAAGSNQTASVRTATTAFSVNPSTGVLTTGAGTLGSNGNGTRTVSNSTATGGSDGDIWYQY